MSKLSTWFSTNKVLLIGLLVSIIMDLQQVIGTAPIDWKVIGLSVAIVITSYLSKNLRGQWITILGSVGSSLSIVLTSVTGHTPIGWFQIISTLSLNILAAVAPAGKSLAYEQSPTVEAAKAEAKAIDSSKVPPINPPVETNTPKP